MPLGSIWNFLKRHRRKFLFTGAFVGGSYLAFQYFKKKFAEFQEKEAEECIEQARRQHHFDSNQRTCNMTVLSMLPNLRDSLRHNMDTERVKGQIQTSSGNKVLLWEELKVMAFSRSIAAVYSSCILVVLLRVQLNIIGGYIYLDNLLKSEMADIEKKELLTANIQEKYLSLIQYFITTGLSELTQAVHSAVESSMGSISLKEKLSLTDVESCVEGIRVRLECGVVQGSSSIATAPLSHFMLPPEQVEDFAHKKNPDEVLFEDLLNQTRDMTESEDFHCVLQTCVNKGFARLLDYVAEGYRSSLSNDGEIDSNFYSLRNVRVPLAKLVPVVNGVMERLCGDSPNPFIQDLLVMEPLRDMAANVYEAFSQRDESSERAGLQR